MNILRAEHPNPQWERKRWKNLNGVWEFELDLGCSAVDRRLWEKEKLDQEILVPFCPESKISGINHIDFMNGIVYRKYFVLNDHEIAGRVFLHFGAVDYEAVIYVNGAFVGTHKGGYTSFSFDITDCVAVGTNMVFVAVRDDGKSGLQPRGKQTSEYYSIRCDYTRTTGIWQTVWLEFVPKAYIKSAKYYPDPENNSLMITGLVEGKGQLHIKAVWGNKTVGFKEVIVRDGKFATLLELTERHLWEVGKGGLYNLLLDFEEDHVKSYFGLRSICFEGRKFLLNGKSVFQRMVLDQGYYQDGIYTAPTEEALIRDIELSVAAGFNGARLHEKVFEPRFLYHCDRLGYLVWGEYPDWGLDKNNPLATEIFMNEWSEVVERDFNHPAIIGWCPFNETFGYFEAQAKNNLITSVYKLTKRLDHTRPCIDASGNFHVMPEIYDIHDYEQNAETYTKRWKDFSEIAKENKGCIPADHEFFAKFPLQANGRGRAPFYSQPYSNQPIFISEYGGIRWVDKETAGWGYGDTPTTVEAFFARYKGLTEALLKNENIFGFCYTQLYDIEQEVNGLYRYDRSEKFDIRIIAEINRQRAAIED